MGVLRAEHRSSDGSASLGRLRRSGVLPMAIVEKGKGTVPIQASERAFRDMMRSAGSARQLQIQLEGESKPRNVILTKIDRDALASRLVHVSFLQVSETDIVTVDVPIHCIGTPGPIERHEGSMLHPTSALKVRGALKDIPEELTIDVAGLELNDSISVSQLAIPEGVEVLTSMDATVVTVKPLRIVEEEVEPEEGEEVEGEVEGEGEGAEGEAPAEPAESE